MSKIYAALNDKGSIIGFYNDEINPTIPEGAIEITEDQWKFLLSKGDTYKYDGTDFVAKTPEEILEGRPPVVVPKTPEQERIEALEAETAGLQDVVLSLMDQLAGMGTTLN